MIETVPEPADPAADVHERVMLLEFLDYFRTVLLRKAAGLTREQLATRLPPSTLTLGGLLKHMALVEDIWFRERWLGEAPAEPWASVDWQAQPDWELESAAHDEPEALAELYLAAIDRSRAAIADRHDLDATCDTRHGPVSLRWILIHMVEEYARHCGHADLLRESIDGATGD